MKKRAFVKFLAALLAAATVLPSAVPFSASTYESGLVGDVNNDEIVSISDLVLFARCIGGDASFFNYFSSDGLYDQCDLNHDFCFDAGDLTRLSRFLAGLISYEDLAVGLLSAGENEDFKYLSEAAAAMPTYAAQDSKQHTVAPNTIAPGLASFSANSIPSLMAKDTVKNKVYSPLSFYMALSDLTETVQGDSQRQILDALGVADTAELRALNQSFFKNLYFENETAKCILANSFWLTDRYSYNQNTLQAMADNYFCQSYICDFADPETAELSNTWLGHFTGNKVPNATLDFSDPELAAILVNTINFEDKWTDEFAWSESDRFTMADASAVEAEYLYKASEEYIISNDLYKKARVRTQNGFSMYFIEPDESTTAQALLSDKAVVNELLSEKIDEDDLLCKLELSVPKFSYDDEMKLVDLTKAMGVTDVFDWQTSDFTPLTTDIPLYVSDIYQKAHIEIDEKGCSAAAYTVIQIANGVALPEDEPPVVEMKLDRPFIYYIAGNDGTPLFVGLVNDPS